MGAHLVWMDLEMTGLNPDKHIILEIATIVTDDALNEVAVGPELAIAAPEGALEAMEEWSQIHHQGSGLLDQVRGSGISLKQAQARTLGFVKQHVAVHQAPLCGNSIWQDRRFLARYMPELEQYLHYRVVDVSSIKELARRWRPDLAAPVAKQSEHRALADIRESIAELRFYRERFFRL